MRRPSWKATRLGAPALGVLLPLLFALMFSPTSSSYGQSPAGPRETSPGGPGAEVPPPDLPSIPAVSPEPGGEVDRVTPASEGVEATTEDDSPPSSIGAEMEADTPPAQGESWSDILLAGGPVGLVIILLSIAAVALVIEHILTIRADVVLPPGVAEDLEELLARGDYNGAIDRCRREPCFLTYVVEAGLLELDGDWNSVEKSVEDATAEQTSRLFRKIEYLNVIGTIAPMLGLLGTVLGMVFAFRELSITEGAATAADLAEGIYLALVTTVEGLLVAIPTLAAFAVFRNRIDYLVAEVTYIVQQLFRPVKRRRFSKAAAGSGESRQTLSQAIKQQKATKKRPGQSGRSAPRRATEDEGPGPARAPEEER